MSCCRPRIARGGGGLRWRALLPLACLALLTAASGRPASAQEEMEDVFGGFGTATTEDAGTPPAGQRPGEGSVAGQVFDGETGLPVGGVTVILTWPAPADGSEPEIEVQVTRPDGSFEFTSVPPLTYTVSFSKAGYRAATMTDFEVVAGQLKRADFPLPPLPTETSGNVLELDAFVVDEQTVGEMMDSLELRMDSDLQLNIMSAEDFSKFAAGDVAEALKRVAGVNIVEGQFAIIRGLEDRYSATTYNGAVIPSPDPDRQSVQLDLFPSEIVSNLQVAKTFAPFLPSNASGGSIDIVTNEYPPEFDLKLKAAAGFNSRAVDRFLSYVPDSPVGKETDGWDTIAQEYGLFTGGRTQLFDRELRFKGVFNWETGYDTAEGYRERREPKRPWIIPRGRQELVRRSASAPYGELPLTAGRFDETLSEFEKQLVGYAGLGFDVDPGGNHRIDASGFYTRKRQEIVDALENGYLRGFDYDSLVAVADSDGGISEPGTYLLTEGENCGVCATDDSWLAKVRDTGGPERGPLFFDNFQESSAFEIDRTLLVAQLNGDHTFPEADGLHLSWAGNWARTTQSQQASRGRIFYEPSTLPDPFPGNGSYPVRVEDLGPGVYALSRGNYFASADDIEETQWFGRLDADYEAALAEAFQVELQAGGWYEAATRNVTAYFLEAQAVQPVGGGNQWALFGDTPLELGRSIVPSLIPGTYGIYTRRNLNESTRDIWAAYLGTKSTFWDQVDLLGGVRLEQIRIQSKNQAVVPQGVADSLRNGAPKTFPEMYLLFDRVDNTSRPGEEIVPPPGFFYNDQLLGLDLPTAPGSCRGGECVDIGWIDNPDDPLTLDEAVAVVEEAISGDIDQLELLPSVGFAWRPLPGVTWRGSWAKTVARPSFREMGFYATVEPGSDDQILGNPKLQLSDVTSYDTRVEWVFGELGDLLAVSGFYKKITNPIESILIRDPINLDQGTLWRTFFNNPNDGHLWGIEIEARRHFDFLGSRWGEYFSLGGNFTYINAEVERTEAELERSQYMFRVSPFDDRTASFKGLESKRRLFGQPEWIVNADLNFDQPDWGTRITLAFFAISDVLEAAGTVGTRPNGDIRQMVFDRYSKSFYQLDLIASQSWSPAFLRGGSLGFKLTAKNLTDSVRGREYDRAQTNGTVSERKLRAGRDFKLSVTYTF